MAMSPDFQPPRDSTPEEAAVTGGVPAAAEAPPQTRGRRSSFVAFAWLAIVIGVVLVIVGLIADQDSQGQFGTIAAGVTLIAAALLTMVGLLTPFVFAALLFLGGIVLAIAAFTAEVFGVAQAFLLGTAAFTFLGAFGSVAASREMAAHPAPDEPGAGVENV